MTLTRNRRPMSRLDPTRTSTLRQAFARSIRRKFRLLKGAIVKFLVTDDAMGLAAPKLGFNVEGDNCGIGPQGFEPGNTCAKGGEVHGGLAKATGTDFTAEQRDAGLAKLKDIPSAEEGYTHFDAEHDQIRMKSLGLIGAGKLFGQIPSSDKMPKIAARMQLNPDQLHYAQIAVTRGGVERKLNGDHSDAETFGSNDLPLVVKEGNEYHLQNGFHRAAAQILAKGHVDARVIEVVGRSKNKIRYGSPTRNEVTTNAPKQFAFHTDPEKLKAFQDWLRQQFASTLTGATDEQLWQRYTEEGFRKGAGRAFDDTTAAERSIGDKSPDFFEGGKREFLRSAFGRPETKEKVQLLASRSFTDLKNVTEDMATRMGRTLADGLVQGKNPREIAKDLDDDLDIGRNRAELIARTEIIRAHSEGQLDSFDALGVDEIGVAVEWSTAGDERVCPECEHFEGIVLKVEEAHGMIPAHPNCRCAFIPANVGEDEKGQTRTKGGIEASLQKGLAAVGKTGEDYGPAKAISAKRPESILNVSPALLEFSRMMANADEGGGDNCGIGPGGFQPGNTCAKGGGGFKVGDKVMFKGAEYTVSGGGDTKKRGPDKGRTPVVMRDSQGGLKVGFEDEVTKVGATAAPKPLAAPKPPVVPTKPVQMPPKPNPAQATKDPPGTYASRPEMNGLAAAQAAAANDILTGFGKPPQNYRLETMKLSDVKPNQHGEDYDNTSSRGLAEHIGKFGTSDRSKYDHDHADYAPIAVDKDKNIVDGNHRHAARKIAGFTHIDVLVPVGPGPGLVINEGDNCGTGAGGFQEGNTCAKGGGGGEPHINPYDAGQADQPHGKIDVPPIPEFLDKTYAAANIKAAQTMREHAEKGDYTALVSTVVGQSPKLLQYRKELIATVLKAKGQMAHDISKEDEKKVVDILAKTEAPKAPESVLHTGKGLSDHVKATLASDSKAKFTELDLKKIEHLNPEGLKTGTVIIGKIHQNAKIKGAEEAKTVGRHLQKDQVEHLKSILPAGTVIKTEHVTKAQIVTKSYGQEGTFTTEKAEKGTSQKAEAPQKGLEHYLPAVTSGTKANLENGPSYDKKAHELWRASLTSPERSAISKWKGSAREIRKQVASGQMDSTTTAFMSAISKAEPHSGVVYRGISGDYAAAIGKQIEEAGVGGHWSDPSPHCTSINHYALDKFGYNGVGLRIVTKSGRPIHKSDGYSGDGSTDEKEIVGMPGTKYRIAGVHKNVTTPHGSHLKYFIDLVEE